MNLSHQFDLVVELWEVISLGERVSIAGFDQEMPPATR